MVGQGSSARRCLATEATAWIPLLNLKSDTTSMLCEPGTHRPSIEDEKGHVARMLCESTLMLMPCCGGVFTEWSIRTCHAARSWDEEGRMVVF